MNYESDTGYQPSDEIIYPTDSGDVIHLFKTDTGALKRAPKPGLPELVINDADPTATAKQLGVMFARGDEFLFNGYAPVRIAVEAGHMPRALEVTTDSVRVLAHELCNPTKLRKGKRGVERITIPLSKDIAQIYLNGLEGRWGLKPFHGITTAPILKNDGRICFINGHDAETGLWCHNIPEINVPDEPTKMDAGAALLRLRTFFQSFPFADSSRVVKNGMIVTDLSQPAGLDESVFLVALITAVIRQSIELAPAFICDAPAYSGAGTGKGLLVKAICMIASGVRPSAFTSGHSAEEFDKRLTAALVEAHPAVFLDNFNAKELRSDILASVLTEYPAKVRVMGHTKMVPLHTRTFIGITGNNIAIAEDMARRSLSAHLDAKMEDPEQRKFAPGFLECVHAQRPALLSDALTIWRWGRQTRLREGKTLGSYELWCQWARDPLLALGMRDPVERLAEIKEADPKRRAVRDFFEVWWVAHADALIKASDVSEEVILIIDDKARRRDDGSLQFSRQRVASHLESLKGTRAGGYAFVQIKTGGTRPIAQYKLQKEAGPL